MSDLPKGALAKLLARGPVDLLWGGVGMGAAAISASFAAYMFTVGPAHVPFPSAAGFGLLAHLGPHHIAEGSHVSPIVPGLSDRMSVASDTPSDDAQNASAAAAPVDFEPTGTVPAQADAKPNGPAAGPPTLKSFVLRDVFDGKALVETRSALRLVAPGSVLDGAGEVLAIRRQGDGWVVATSKGLITAPMAQP